MMFLATVGWVKPPTVNPVCPILKLESPETIEKEYF